MRQRAFTLIEMLVVLAIALLLVALLGGAWGAAVQQAHRVGCASKLRQIGIAFEVYAQDNDERLPPGAYPVSWVAPHANWDRSWQDLLLPYVGQGYEAFRCPDVREEQGYRFSYGANPYACPYLTGGRALTVTQPGSFVLVAEKSTGDWPFAPWPDAARPTPYLTGRHRGQAGLLFFDLHVQFVDPARLVRVEVPGP